MSTIILKKWKKLDVPGRLTFIDKEGNIGICRDFDVIRRRPSIDAYGRKYMPIAGRNRYVHRLVAEIFVPNPRGHARIEFINGNKGDARADNLRWVPSVTRRVHRGPALSMIDVHRIRALIARHDSTTSIAKHYGVSTSLISHIKAGRRWGNV